MEEHEFACIILVTVNNLVLLQKKGLAYKHWPGSWCLFGGGLKKDETPEAAIRREIKEELDYELKDLQLFKFYTSQEQYRQVKAHVFVATFTGSLATLSLREGVGFAFFSEEETRHLPMIDHNLIVLQEYFRARRK